METVENPVNKSNEEIAKEVINGLWGNGQDRKQRLKNAGYNADEIQKLVNIILSGKTISNKKSNEQIAKEVILGIWGNGLTRRIKLKKAGYNPTEIQKIVNRLLK